MPCSRSHLLPGGSPHPVTDPCGTDTPATWPQGSQLDRDILAAELPLWLAEATDTNCCPISPVRCFPSHPLRYWSISNSSKLPANRSQKLFPGEPSLQQIWPYWIYFSSNCLMHNLTPFHWTINPFDIKCPLCHNLNFPLNKDLFYGLTVWLFYLYFLKVSPHYFNSVDLE